MFMVEQVLATIAKEVNRAYEWEINLSSEVGKGSLFSIVLKDIEIFLLTALILQMKKKIYLLILKQVSVLNQQRF